MAAAATTPEPAKPSAILPPPRCSKYRSGYAESAETQTAEGIDNPMRVEPEARVGGASENTNAPKNRQRW